jgi:hypothetical protein
VENSNEESKEGGEGSGSMTKADDCLEAVEFNGEVRQARVEVDEEEEEDEEAEEEKGAGLE